MTKLLLCLTALLAPTALPTTSAQATTNTRINANANANANANFVLNLLHVNDHHSHLEEETFLIPQATLPNLANQARRVHYGGYPRLIKLMKYYKAIDANVLKVHAGDAITGTAFYQLFGNQPDVDMMHEVCFDAVNLGNHEFDDGDAQLASFVRKLTDQDSPCQNTRVLSANLVPGSTSPLLPLKQQGYIAPFAIRSFNNGRDKVAIIGVDVRDKTLSGSSPDQGTTLTDERQAVRDQVQKLTASGINKIVLLSHVGYARDMNWMTKIDGVDVVVGGHSHTLLGNKNNNIDAVLETSKTHDSYPQISHQQDSGKAVCIVHAWKFSHGLGRLRVEFDSKGDVIMCGGQFIVPFQPNALATTEEQTQVTNYLKGLGPAFIYMTQDQSALAKLKAYSDAAGNNQALTKTVALNSAQTICNDAIPGEGRNSLLCKPNDTASHGGAACNLVAHAMLNQTVMADVAIQNAGGCRTDIRSGNFTYGDAMEFLPYSDTMVTMDLTGDQIKRVLEQALDLAFRGESSGAYPYASGLRFDVNATSSAGSGMAQERISNLQVNARLEEGTWNDIDMNTTYTVVTNSFLAAGHDGYLEFADMLYSQTDTQTSYLDAFIRYVEEQGGLSSPDPEEMSTHTYVGPTEGGSLATDTSNNDEEDDGSEDSNDELNGIWLVEPVDGMEGADQDHPQDEGALPDTLGVWNDASPFDSSNASSDLELSDDTSANGGQASSSKSTSFLVSTLLTITACWLRL